MPVSCFVIVYPGIFIIYRISIKKLSMEKNITEIYEIKVKAGLCLTLFLLFIIIFEL